MDEHLRLHAGQTLQRVRVPVTQQEHQLKEQKTRDPNRSRAAKQRQHHLANHRFAYEQQKCAQKDCRGKK